MKIKLLLAAVFILSGFTCSKKIPKDKSDKDPLDSYEQMIEERRRRYLEECKLECGPGRMKGYSFDENHRLIKCDCE